MGNTADGFIADNQHQYPSHVQPKPQKKRRPSIHSGRDKLFLDLPAVNRHSSTQSLSALSDMKADEKENENPNTPNTSSTGSIEFGTTMPAPHKKSKYRNSLEVTYNFWRSHIDTLNEAEHKATAVLLYVHVFKLIPSSRPLFSKNIELQGKHFFGLWRWMVTNLKTGDRRRLVSKVRILGTLHQKKEVKPEWYPLFLQAFHETMAETVKEKYTPRVRFCVQCLFEVVSNFMTNQDFESLPSAKTTRMLPILSKLRHVLHDEAGLNTLELYMKERFCAEYLLFYRDVRRFKAMSSKEEQQLQKLTGEQILRRYIDKNAECEINVSDSHKVAIYERLKANDQVFDREVFDLCMAECKEYIKRNIWHSFKKTVMKMAMASVDAKNPAANQGGYTPNMQYAQSSKMHTPSTPQPAAPPRYASAPNVHRSRHQASASMPVHIDFSTQDMDFSYM